MSYKIGSLFAGVGGICQAFKDVSCNVVWANEKDINSCKTYQLNHSDTKLFVDDILNLKVDMLEKVDILTAGFPCQPFSVASHGKGFEDDRGQLFFEFIRLLKELKPQSFFLENVKTIVNHNDGQSFKIVREAVFNSGYSFIPFVLNASEYSDIPQGRERIYIVGFKNEPDYFFDHPTKSNVHPNITEPSLSSKFIIPSKWIDKRKKVKDFLDQNTVKNDDYYNNPDKKIHKIVMESVIDENTVYQYRRYYLRSNKSNVCPTLTANMGGGGHNIPIILDGTYPRRLTPKECFNLQGFPKEFKLPSDVSRRELYKQSGNTVVVPVVKRIAKELIRVLNET